MCVCQRILICFCFIFLLHPLNKYMARDKRVCVCFYILLNTYNLYRYTDMMTNIHIHNLTKNILKHGVIIILFLFYFLNNVIYICYADTHSEVVIKIFTNISETLNICEPFIESFKTNKKMSF